MLKVSVKHFWASYTQLRNREEKLLLLKMFHEFVMQKAVKLDDTATKLIQIMENWENSAELYDELQTVRRINTEVFQHIRKHGSSMNEDMFARFMKTWSTLNDYLRVLKAAWAVMCENTEVVNILNLAKQAAKNKKNAGD